MEDLVEEMLRLRGFRYERNIRVRGRSGSLHEVDFLVYTRAGPVLYEVKNYSRPAPKEVVIKAFEVARDIGAVSVVVVSSSGFTGDAIKVARSLGVELADLDSVVNAIEAAKAERDALYLTVTLDEETAAKALRSEARKRLLVIRVEKLSSVTCVYAPFYYFEGEIEYRSGYRRLTVAASGVSGLPLALRRGVLAESSARAAAVPADLLQAYASVAGSVVTRQALASRLGESRARRLLAALADAGLAVRLGGRPARYRIIDDRASLESLEDAASLFVWRASQAPAAGCGVVQPAVSPGAALSLISSLYGFAATGQRLVYAPVYIGTLESHGGKVYRLAYVTGWTRRPIRYKPHRDFRVLSR